MTASKAAEAGYIKEFTVASNDNKGNISRAGGLVNFQYFESIMDNTVKVSAVFNESGDSINGKTARSGLPIVTEERGTIKIEDNNKNTIEFSEWWQEAERIIKDRSDKVETIYFDDLLEHDHDHVKNVKKMIEHIKHYIGE